MKESPSPKQQRQQQYLERVRANRRRGGKGSLYYYNALLHKTPLVFRGYDGQDVTALIVADGGTRFTLKVPATPQGVRVVVDKLQLQYACRAKSHAQVQAAVQIDESIRKQGLQPIVEVAERYAIPDGDLQRCRNQGHRLQLRLRGGDVLEGRVEWFGAYDIKLELATGKSAVVFRHAVYQHEIRST